MLNTLTGPLTLLGCGKMGSAMLQGWLDAGLAPRKIEIFDPYPSDWLRSECAARHIALNPETPRMADMLMLAVKPQMMEEAMSLAADLCGPDTRVLSIAAGTPLQFFESKLPEGLAIIRAMPNTPAAVKAGITAIIGNRVCSDVDLDMAEALLSSIGDVVRLDDEAQMDAVTGVSGSGPAYVFHMIEALATAAEAAGMEPDLAMKLARQTIIGAALLARDSAETAEQLRINVTSPGGTTQAGLKVLMNPEKGLGHLMEATVAAATKRSRELAG